MGSLRSGFSPEIEAHCWRLSHGVSQGEQRPPGAPVPPSRSGGPAGASERRARWGRSGLIRAWECGEVSLGGFWKEHREEGPRPRAPSAAAAPAAPAEPRCPGRRPGRAQKPSPRDPARSPPLTRPDGHRPGRGHQQVLAERRTLLKTITAFVRVQPRGVKPLRGAAPASPPSTPRAFPCSPAEPVPVQLQLPPPPRSPGTSNLPLPL